MEFGFNAAKTRKPLKFAGVPQTRQSSTPLVGRSLPYYEDVWTIYRCLTTFFRLSVHASAAKIQPDKVVRWCRPMADVQSPTAEIRRGKKKEEERR